MSHENFEVLCSLHALNLLDQTDKEWLEAHIQTGCSVCPQILKETLEAISLLPYVLPSMVPPPSVKEKLISQVQAELEEKIPRPAQRITRVAERTWLPSPIPGVEVQRLWSSTGRSAWLVRSQSGATFPPHHHRGPELVYILQGKATINGNPVAAGDFCASDPGFIDQDVRCEAGCMFLLISNDDDEFL